MADSPTIPAVDKAVKLLNAVAAGAGRGSMAELARALDMAPSTCFRLIKTLEQHDWLRPREGGGYELSLGLMPLVEPLVGMNRLAEALREPLSALTSRTGLGCKLSIREAHSQLVLLRVESPGPVSVSGRVGARMSVLTGSSGAALLSDRPDEHIASIIDAADEQVWQEQPVDEVWRRVAECRETGLCHSIGVHPQGIEAVSAPIAGAKGVVFAVVTVMGLRGDLSDERLPDIRTALRETASAAAQHVAGLTATGKTQEE